MPYTANIRSSQFVHICYAHDYAADRHLFHVNGAPVSNGTVTVVGSESASDANFVLGGNEALAEKLGGGLV